MFRQLLGLNTNPAIVFGQLGSALPIHPVVMAICHNLPGSAMLIRALAHDTTSTFELESLGPYDLREPYVGGGYGMEFLQNLTGAKQSHRLGILAARSGNTHALQALHEVGYRFKPRGWTEIYEGCRVNSVGVVRFASEVLGQSLVASTIKDRSTPLQVAIKESSIDVIEHMCAHGGILTALDDDSKTATAMMCLRRSSQCIFPLLRHGCELAVPDLDEAREGGGGGATSFPLMDRHTERRVPSFDWACLVRLIVEHGDGPDAAMEIIGRNKSAMRLLGEMCTRLCGKAQGEGHEDEGTASRTGEVAAQLVGLEGLDELTLPAFHWLADTGIVSPEIAGFLAMKLRLRQLLEIAMKLGNTPGTSYLLQACS